MKRTLWVFILFLLLTRAVCAETCYVPLVQTNRFIWPGWVHIDIHGRDYPDEHTYHVWGTVQNDTVHNVKNVWMKFKLSSQGELCFEGVMPIIDYLPQGASRAFDGRVDTGDSRHCLGYMSWSIRYDLIDD